MYLHQKAGGLEDSRGLIRVPPFYIRKSERSVMLATYGCKEQVETESYAAVIVIFSPLRLFMILLTVAMVNSF